MLKDDSPTDNRISLSRMSVVAKGELPSVYISRSCRPYVVLCGHLFPALAVCSILLAQTACAASKIGGTYVSSDANSVAMLQLTQTAAGQVTGAFSCIKLNKDGTVHPEQVSITGGTLDGDQLTLTFQGLFGHNLAGTMKGDTIQLQMVGSDGDVGSSEFRRSSADEFKTFADQLKIKGEGIALTARLLKQTQALRQTVRTAEAWISDAELHADRIPGVKDHYRKIETEMRMLVARERATPNSLARGQISLKVGQGNLAGGQVDLQVNQMWDHTIGEAARDLRDKFAAYPAACPTRDEFIKRGASLPAIDDWRDACQSALSERAKFEPVFKRIAEQRAELKAFQMATQSRRQALVDEASGLQ